MRDFSPVDKQIRWLRDWWEENRPEIDHYFLRSMAETFCLLHVGEEGNCDVGVKVSIIWEKERLPLELNRHCVCSYGVYGEITYCFHPFPELGKFYPLGIFRSVERT